MVLKHAMNNSNLNQLKEYLETLIGEINYHITLEQDNPNYDDLREILYFIENRLPLTENNEFVNIKLKIKEISRYIYNISLDELYKG